VKEITARRVRTAKLGYAMPLPKHGVRGFCMRNYADRFIQGREAGLQADEPALSDGAVAPARDGIFELADKATSYIGAEPFVVAFIGDTEWNIVLLFLQRFPAASVILNERDVGDVHNPRIGRLHGPYPDWDFPSGTFKNIIVLGERNNVALRALHAAFRAGVRRFIFVHPVLGTLKSSSIYSLSAVEIAKRLLRESVAACRTIFKRLRKAILFILHRLLMIAALLGLIAKNLLVEVLPEKRRIELSILKIKLYNLFRKFSNRLALAQEAMRKSRLVMFVRHRRSDFIFTQRLRRLFKQAEKIRGFVEVRPECVVLAIGTLGSGGAERQIVNTALALAAEGRFRPIVLCSHLSDSDSTFYQHVLDEAGIKVVDLKKINFFATAEKHAALVEFCHAELVKLPYNISDVTRFLLFLLQERPYIVHSFLDETNIKSGIASVLAGVPRIVLSLRNAAPDNFIFHTSYMRPSYEVMMGRPEVMLCNNSYAGANDYRRWLGKPGLGIDILNNGVDFNRFSSRSEVDQETRARLGIPKEALVVGSVMRLCEEKQPLLWAKVVKEISQRCPHVHFALAGIGPLRNSVEKIIADAGVQKRVHILGQIRNIVPVMHSFDIFLLTSRLEGLPNVLIEAQAVGLPVVTTPAGGAAETLDPGRTGLVTDDQSVESITRACLQLIDDADLRARFAKAAPDFVAKKFSIQRMLERTLALYDS
jgi:glycosyltransferase involved in cell wall biosynthesis